jgi:membrane protease YdiL (CAAX protease family)
MMRASLSVGPAGPAAVRRRPVSTAGTLVLVGLGGAALVFRARLLVLPESERILAMAALFGSILVASLLIPVAPGRRHLHPAVVMLVGLAAVAGAAFAAGPPVTIPFGPWALPLALLAAVAEEALFRRAAYGALEPAGPVVAIGVTSLLFAVIHIPLYGVAAFPVDLGAALVFGWQRWASGNWTAPATAHAAANLLAVLAR